MEVCPEELFQLAKKILSDQKGFEQQEKLSQPDVESVLFTKTYSTKNLPDGVNEEELKKFNLFGKEILKVTGSVNLSLEQIITCINHPETRKIGNPKYMVVETLERPYLGDENCFVTFGVMNSGSFLVSNRSNLLESKMKRIGDDKMILLQRSLDSHPKLASVYDEKKNKVVRAIYHASGMILEKDGDKKTKFALFASVSLEGMIPAAVGKFFLRKTPLEIPSTWLTQAKHLNV